MIDVFYDLVREVDDATELDDRPLICNVLLAIPDGWARIDGRWVRIVHHSTREMTGARLYCTIDHWPEPTFDKEQADG